MFCYYNSASQNIAEHNTSIVNVLIEDADNIHDDMINMIIYTIYTTKEYITTKLRLLNTHKLIPQ